VRSLSNSSVWVILLMVAVPVMAKAQTEESNTALMAPRFSEDVTKSSDWTFDWHGYVRMPIRFRGSPWDAEPPYLIDDDYYDSGFAYTRVNETEWAELFFQAAIGRTRVVIGLFSSQISDYSRPSVPEQAGIATAFVEHGFEAGSWLDFKLRAGMFWDRFGYLEPYDTYLFGRTHVGGMSVDALFVDWVSLRAGYGIHADFLSDNQGMTPLAWARVGVTQDGFDVGGYAFRTWTTDSNRGFASVIEDGSLRILGGDARVAVPHMGSIYAGLSWIKARSIASMSDSIELLHSTGGISLTRNYLDESGIGNGEILASAFDVQWQPAKTLAWLAGADTGRALDGLDCRFFGMTAWVLSKQQSDDPTINRHDRLYFKWGALLRYQLPTEPIGALFASLRYDRVILDVDHDDLSFRMLTPRLGITPTEGVEVFLSYSKYYYGEKIRLRDKQIKGDLTASHPHDHVFKLQAQASW
jgi:hypothetical protein